MYGMFVVHFHVRNTLNREFIVVLVLCDVKTLKFEVRLCNSAFNGTKKV